MRRTLDLARAWIKFSWFFLYSVYLRRPWSLPPHTWIWLYFRGFMPNKARMYKFKEHDCRMYISDRGIFLTSKIDGSYGPIIDDKYMSALLLQPIVRIPRTLAYIRNREIQQPRQDQDLADLVRQHGKTILKPTDGNCGRGIAVLEFLEGRFLKNNKPVDEDKLEACLPPRGTFLLSEYVKQREFASRLYPDTVNTMRLITMIDPDTGIPFLAGGVLKAGTSKSYPVDNHASGGVCCLIDIATGRLGRMKRLPFNWLEAHPDTGIKMEGMIIPDWEDIKSELLKISGILSPIPYIAWDIALLDSGICVIETNSWSELSMLQLNTPLCANPAIHRFFYHHRITGYRRSGAVSSETGQL